MENLGGLKDFYAGKRVLVTGHTGFKGTWLSHILERMGAEVWGYALPPVWESMYRCVPASIHSVYGDLRNREHFWSFMEKIQPEMVFHLAAQPLVQVGYENPLETYEINAMGTANVLEGIRKQKSVRSVIIVTTDKVYGQEQGVLKEDDKLDGFDPYSNSKSCAELMTACYKRCFLEENGVALSCVRAGNVIGGGDFGLNRIIPDCIRYAGAKVPIKLRHPHGIRPYQFVLEPLSAYLFLGKRQWEEPDLADTYNIAPDPKEERENRQLADLFCEKWGEGASWIYEENRNMGEEREILRLDGTKLKEKTGWAPMWSLERGIEETVYWAKAYMRGEDMQVETKRQILSYFEERGEKL